MNLSTEQEARQDPESRLRTPGESREKDREMEGGPPLTELKNQIRQNTCRGFLPACRGRYRKRNVSAEKVGEKELVFQAVFQ